MRLKLRLAIGAVLAVAGLLAVAAVAERHATAQQQPGDPGLEEFIPSEKLPADSSISFPVDI
jgi:hypothetical protein